MTITLSSTETKEEKDAKDIKNMDASAVEYL